MSETVIKVENLSKKYTIGTKSSSSLRETLVDGWNNLIGKIKVDSKEFWALKNVSFEVKQGEVLGIIGKNGAGKSTLLKVLSRITEPTSGRAEINGRVSSLLEVGTGFHPELTGRENIFLNGTILGMSRKEVKTKFDEILDFSGVERFIDTPVKHYSSGMYVRLAFAVAAHLEPKILIIDEVLAVGDAEFQKKCLGKMKDVSEQQGRTVLFVSHNMGAIRSLCSTSALLVNGTLKMISQTETVIKKYLSIEQQSETYISKKVEGLFLKYAQLVTGEGTTTNVFDFNSKICVQMNFHLIKIPIGLNVTVVLQNAYKNRIFSVDIDISKYSKIIDNKLELLFTFPKLPYAPSNYSLIIGLHIPNNITFEIIEDILPFTIIDKGSYLSKYYSFTGDMLVEGSWKVLNKRDNDSI